MLKVNEIFGPTVQGEGRNAGKPCVFLRLSGCNLHCIWCDTPHTWNWIGTPFLHPDKYKREEEEHEKSVEEIVSFIESKRGGGISHLVISGGEPLTQQKRLMPLLKRLKKDGWTIEVETNGTVPPKEDVVKNVDQLNVSPKLSNSGDPEKLRIRKRALKELVECRKANFKFVIGCEADVEEALGVIEYLRECGPSEIRLMPLCQTREELEKNLPLVERMAKKHNLLWTSRLSIEMSGTKRGV